MNAEDYGGTARQRDAAPATAPATAGAASPVRGAAMRHIRLSSHPGGTAKPVAIEWGAADPKARGPVLGSVRDGTRRNVIGAHSGSYALYRALAVAAGRLDPVHVPDFTDTAPAEPIGPYPQWSQPDRIVSLDPWGHMVSEAYAEDIADGLDIRPTIAVTKAHLTVPEVKGAIEAGRLAPDGEVLTAAGDVRVTKMAIEPVWYLPGIADRFRIGEPELRRALFEESGGMYTELVTRPDIKVFLPPVGGITVYGFGDVAAPARSGAAVTCRVHDECNGSDVFGSDICTCRPYLAHGIEECVAAAQGGGTGFVVYNRKEGRALGEVTKFLVYNARKRQPGGDRAETYFERTECVAGVQDMRFQEIMPDVLHWLGIRRIERFVSMSDMKRDAIEAQGIEIDRQVPIPPELVPDDAQVEITAKRAAGYYSEDGAPSTGELRRHAGRSLRD